MNTKKLVRIAFLTALGILLMYIAFPLPFFPPFMTYDFGDLPGLIAAFAMGPWIGVLVQFLKCLLGYFLGVSKAGLVGMAANFIAGGTMILVAGLIYQHRKTKLTAVISLLVGTVVTALVMIPVNYFIFFPLWGVANESLLVMALTVSFPFNLVKFLLTSVLTFVLYKAVKNVLEEKDFRSSEPRLNDDRA
ncbi:MAG TPA: ECF transporter S component [Peptococcaceae bacterium]|jgi:riboflavin transporter FmnP|nr:ECF transporter S component [Clostridia bacterium]HOB82711.1 ECF transporter S component [Peptococcaceae bacterium]HPZ71891.1 ECF transporter S component [Peptococcaceae bacterium]HQD54798.1 ECF transporter S component [Peptococcaceae bacterium]